MMLNQVNAMIGLGVTTRYDAIASLASAAGNGTVDMQRNVAVVLSNL